MQAANTLKTAARQSNILYGAATSPRILSADADFSSEVVAQCDVLVPENELKWESVEPQPGVFDFSQGDWLLDFCTKNGMALRGHCLVWHKQLPAWAGSVTTAAQAEDQLAGHIRGLVSHYAGRLHSWDVVNEALNPSDGRSDGLRNTVWLNALGPDYIDLAYRTAAEADPEAVLVYNEYGLEAGTSDGNARRASLLKLVGGMKRRGTPIHALGLQSHLSADGFSASKLSNFLKQVQDLGLKIFITELDIADQKFPANIAIRDTDVADLYRQYLKTVLANSAVTTVLTWGLSDRYTWLSSTAPRADGLSVRPLPFSSNLLPKTARDAIIEAFAAAEPR